MPGGTCDPASLGYAYWETSQAQGPNGEVLVTFRYGWDGVSVKPDCVGPVSYVKGTNTGAVTYYVHLKGRRGTVRTIALEPGQTLEESRRPVLRNLGLETNQDVEGMAITTDPTPPTNLKV